MKQQNRLLSRSLYKEGLLQLRFMGLLAGGLIVLASMAQTLFTILTLRGVDMSSLGGLAFAVDPFSLLSLASLAVYLLPFLFVLRLFSFLNKRGSSDFFHALPVSRVTLYFSFVAAALTWIWGIGLVVVALTAVTNLIGGVAITAPVVFSALGMFMTASLFAVAASLVAVSITGTVFSNLVVTALIVFLPHVISSCFVQSASALLPNIPPEYIGFVGGASLQNTFFMLSPFSSLSAATLARPVSYGGSIAVSFTWSVALVCLGAWLFRRRASEAAGKSAPSRRLQLVYRVAIGVMVVALGMGSVLSSADPAAINPLGLPVIVTGPTSGSSLISLIVPMAILLVFALVVVLVFEIITTRKWGRLVRALPSFALVVLFALAFYGVVSLYASYEKSFRPQADQIASVKLLSTRYDMEMNSYYGGPGLSDLLYGGLASVDGQPPTYNKLLLQQTSITDPAFIRESASKLQERVSPDIRYGTAENHSIMLLEVRMKNGRTAFRLIDARTAGKQPDSFSKTVFSTPEVTDALLALPPIDKHTELNGNAYMSLYDMSSAPIIGKAEQARRTRELYDTFRSEYAQLSPADQYQLLDWMYSGTPFTPSGETTTIVAFTGQVNLDITGLVGTKTYMNSYALILPKSAKTSWGMTRSELARGLDTRKTGFHLDSLNLFRPQALYAMNGIVEAKDTTDMDPSWSVMTQRAVQIYGNNETGTYKSSVIGDREMEKAVAIIRPALSRGFAIDAPWFVQIDYGLYNKKNQQQGSNSLIVALTKQEADALQALTK